MSDSCATVCGMRKSFTIESAKARLKKYTWIRRTLDVAGSAWPVFAFLGSLSVMTAGIGFFVDHPHWAIAAAMVVAAFGMWLITLATDYITKHQLENKLVIDLGPASIDEDESGSGKVAVTFHYNVFNVADFDLYFVFESDNYFVGSLRAEEGPSTPLNILSAKSSRRFHSYKVTGVSKDRMSHGEVAITAAYGKTKDALSCRLDFKAHVYLAPSKQSGLTEHSHIILRNDYSLRSD